MGAESCKVEQGGPTSGNAVISSGFALYTGFFWTRRNVDSYPRYLFSSFFSPSWFDNALYRVVTLTTMSSHFPLPTCALMSQPQQTHFIPVPKAFQRSTFRAFQIFSSPVFDLSSKDDRIPDDMPMRSTTPPLTSPVMSSLSLTRGEYKTLENAADY